MRDPLRDHPPPEVFCVADARVSRRCLPVNGAGLRRFNDDRAILHTLHFIADSDNPTNTPSTVVSMLNMLSNEITGALQDMQSSLARNPSLNNQIQAKIRMLQSPSLKNDIINGQFWSRRPPRHSTGARCQSR